jgi:hypothetical protein
LGLGENNGLPPLVEELLDERGVDRGIRECGNIELNLPDKPLDLCLGGVVRFFLVVGEEGFLSLVGIDVGLGCDLRLRGLFFGLFLAPSLARPLNRLGILERLIDRWEEVVRSDGCDLVTF